MSRVVTFSARGEHAGSPDATWARVSDAVTPRGAGRRREINRSGVRTMPYALCFLRSQDIPQATEIEREAFPTLFPPPSFRRELKNRMASYLVATGSAAGAPRLEAQRTLIGRLLSSARSAVGDGRATPYGEFVAGFVGTWYLVDGAHIVSVGVRRDLRGRGVGELLLIGAIEHAMARGAAVATLEVRPTNAVARNLYGKYGFTDRGVRKGYYSDNREDAIMMSTGSIQSAEYEGFFRQLEREHTRRWGRFERTLIT